MSNANMSEAQKSIVLIGFMGVGKTTVGELVAQKLQRTFVDVDKEIEKELGLSIPDIFNQHGELFFREYEKKKTCELAQKKFMVLSLGGGAFLQPEIQKTCLQHCTVIYLDVTWDEWTERLDLLIDSRPILQSKDLSEIKELFYKRQDAYSINHSKEVINRRSPEEVADSIVDSFKNSWKLCESNKS